jgi:hypothetical protein
MQAFILIGSRFDNGKPVVENIYTGLDGVALQEASDKAAESGRYIAIGKIVNPSCTPMPITGVKTEVTTPAFPRSGGGVTPRVRQSPPHILARDAQEKRNRENRLNPTPVSVKADSSGLRTDGPTMEEFIDAGYPPSRYPPVGWTEKPSPALDAYRANGDEGLDSLGLTIPGSGAKDTSGEENDAGSPPDANAGHPVETAKAPTLPQTPPATGKPSRLKSKK